jgi:AraC-like DNA-binding protein
MTTVWSTDNVPRRERLSYWTDAVCDTYVQLGCDVPGETKDISGEIRLAQLATLGLSRVTATSQWVRRTPDRIARATEDYFIVSIQSAGTGRVVQDGRSALLRPGDFALYDSTRPYELIFTDDFQQYVLQLPGAVLRSRLKRTETLTARAVSGERGAGHLMISMVRLLATDLDTLEPASVAAVADSVENILVAGLCTLPGAGEPAAVTLAAVHRDQIKAYVRVHLRDAGLSVASIAAHLGLSPSTVHRAFAGQPESISGWIWAQRLDGARRDLCDPAQAGRNVSEIAFDWGFNDAAHFSPAFRDRFGCSPRELRATCLRNDR